MPAEIEVTAIVTLPPEVNTSAYFKGALNISESAVLEAKCSNVIVSLTEPLYDRVNTIVESVPPVAVIPNSASAIIFV